MEDWHETEIRVRYAETDQMGIVHHANYLIWFEAGRSELCRARGFSYKEMEDKDNALMVVAESYCRYKSPAFYEDVLSIRTSVGEVRSRSDTILLRDCPPVRRHAARRGRNAPPRDRSKIKRSARSPKSTDNLLSEPQPQEQAFPANQAPH